MATMPKILTLWPFKKGFADPLVNEEEKGDNPYRGRLHWENVGSLGMNSLTFLNPRALIYKCPGMYTQLRLLPSGLWEEGKWQAFPAFRTAASSLLTSTLLEESPSLSLSSIFCLSLYYNPVLTLPAPTKPEAPVVLNSVSFTFTGSAGSFHRAPPTARLPTVTAYFRLSSALTRTFSHPRLPTQPLMLPALPLCLQGYCSKMQT